LTNVVIDEPLSSKLTRIQFQNLRVWKAGLSLLLVEFAALALLRLGFGVVPSLIVPAAIAFAFLLWPGSLFLMICVGTFGCRFAQSLLRRLIDRRSYRFSLTALFVTVLICALGFAWYGARLRAVSAERTMFSGRWRVLNQDGTPLLANGQQVTWGAQRFENCTFHAPRGDIGWIDFHNAGKVSRSIYCVQGNRVLIGQGHWDEPRPTVFERDHNWCRIHPEEFEDCSNHDHYCVYIWLIEPVDEG
jgi:hypothetical protein